MDQNIFVIGQGGREHAIAWKLSKSNKVDNVYVCPGNGGTSLEENIINVDINIEDKDSLINFAKNNNIIMTIVGPEGPLVDGIVNSFIENGLKIFGPTKEYAILEGSKVFSKEFMEKFDIPTSSFRMFSDNIEAKNYIKNKKYPIVVKADGLAAGKGVIISNDEDEAINAIDKLLDSNHSEYIVIEDFLIGQELSAIYICNFKGASYEIGLPWTKDYKSRDEFNSGPNTGGMGAVSHPLGYQHKNLLFKLHLEIEKILIKTIAAINNYNKKTNKNYLGFLYIGLMINNDNDIKVLEYNCRLGDPETQNLMLTLENQNIDLYDLIVNDPINSIKDFNLLKIDTEESSYCCTIVLAAKGYPDAYAKDFFLDISHIKQSDKIKIFHAGTVIKNNKIQVVGGRILTVNVFADTKEEAVNLAYENIKKINVFEDENLSVQNQNLVFYRDDIGN
ncbi:MAG: phosphoribosylamine--glycine ligase [Gammaproteobacteria bacterium]